jgi:hypothetical protein
LACSLDVHDTDEAIFGDEREGELGADLRVGGDVDARRCDVVEEDGLAGEGDLADHAAAEGNAGALGRRSVADLEAHAEFVGAVVEQEDGEDAVRNDGAHKFRGAVEEGLQVEGGVEGLGELRKIGNIGRFRRVR